MTRMAAHVAVSYNAKIAAGYRVEVPADVHPADQAGWAVGAYTDGDRVHYEEINNEGLVVDSVEIYELESEERQGRETLAGSSGVDLIAAERARQVGEEGRTSEHDATHTDGALAVAAAVYAMPYNNSWKAQMWPFPEPLRIGPRTWDGRIRDLVKAGALIAAEIDRLQRA